MRHNIMPGDQLVLVAALKINILSVLFQFFHLFLGYRQVQIMLSLRQNDPEPPPQFCTVRF